MRPPGGAATRVVTDRATSLCRIARRASPDGETSHCEPTDRQRADGNPTERDHADGDATHRHQSARQAADGQYTECPAADGDDAAGLAGTAVRSRSNGNVKQAKSRHNA